MKLVISCLLAMANFGLVLAETPFEALVAAYEDALGADLPDAATQDGIYVDDLIVAERCYNEYLVALSCIGSIPLTDCVFSCTTTFDPDLETSCEIYGSTFCDIYIGCCGENYSCRSSYELLLQCIRTQVFGCNGNVCDANGGAGSTTTTVASTGGGGGCFSATSTVDVLGKGPVEMQDLSINDQILTHNALGQVEYEPVYAFGHNIKETVDKFYQLKTKSITLEVTGEHLVYIHGKANPVRADSIKVGDALIDSNGSPITISKIKTVVKAGLYAPQTPSGKLFVNGVLASAYPAMQVADEYVELSVGSKTIKTGLSLHDITHCGAAVTRVFCEGVSSSFCTKYDSNGMSLIFGIGNDYVLWATASQKPLLVQWLLMAATVPIVLLCVALEMSVGASLGPVVLFLAGFAGYYYHNNRKAEADSEMVKPKKNI